MALIGPPSQGAQRVRPGLAVRQQPVVALEAAHRSPGAAVVQAVRPDVQHALDAPNGRTALPELQDAVVRAVDVVVAIVRCDQRTPGGPTWPSSSRW